MEMQQVVDELRFILQREVVDKSDELTSLVAEYSRLCHEVNVRLRRCDECLKQGLRSEAVHLADAKPNLLDAVAVLDFDGRSELLEIIGMYFIDPPEPLLLEVATALNSAYAEHEPLKKMLDLHRVLALGRAPLTERLAVLRSLAELDNITPLWGDDVREMERARFRELDAQSVGAAKAGNAAELQALVAEVQNSDWFEPVPNALLRDLKNRTNQTIRTNARERIVELNDDLHAAFSELNLTAARRLRDAWKQTRELIPVDNNDPLVDGVAPILAWLEDEDRKEAVSRAFTTLIGDIERALDDEEVTSEQLKRLKVNADRSDRRLPPMLETRFRSRLGTLEFNDNRRKKMILGAAAGGVALIAIVIGSLVYWSVENDKTRRLVAAANSFIDDGKLEEAQKIVEQRTRAGATGPWLDVQKKLADAVQAEQERVVNWKASVAAARDASDLAQIEAALKQARQFSKTAEEKIEVGQLQAQWQKRTDEVTAVREKEFRQAIATLTAELKALDVALNSSEAFNVHQIQPLVDGIEIQLAQLLPQRSTVSKELSSQAGLVESRFRASQKTATDLSEKAQIFDRMTDAVLLLPENALSAVQTDRYEALLKEFVETLPHDPRVETLKKAAELSPLPATIAMQRLVKRLGHLIPADKGTLEVRLKDLRGFIKEHPQSPDRELMTRYEAWLASLLRRVEVDGDPDEGLKSRVSSLFGSKFIKDGFVVYDNEGNTYYLTKPPPEPFGNPVSLNYLTGFNGETRQVSLKLENLSPPKSQAPPQKEIAQKVRATIREVPTSGWRDYFLDLTQSLLKAEKMDPFLRYVLVLKSLEYAGRGDRLLELELTPVVRKLQDDEIDRSVAWIDPTDKAAGEARERARELLATIPPIEPLFAAASKRQTQLEQELFTPRFSVGWLEKTRNGKWTCRTKWVPERDFALYVVGLPDTNGARSWSLLGRASREAFKFDDVVAESVGEAAVVYASVGSLDPKTALLP